MQFTGSITTGLALGAVLAVAAAAPASAGSRPRADFSLDFSARSPGVRTAVHLKILYKAEDPEAKPSPIRRIVIRTPSGTRFDTAALPRCDASNEELMSQGDAACPPGSLLGGGKLTAVTGLGPTVDPFATEVSIYNYDHEMVELVKDAQSGAPLATDHFEIDGNVWTAHPPTTPGGPPDGESAVREVDFAYTPKAAWATTPRRCGRDRVWRSTGTFTYADGTTVTVPDETPCARPAPRPREQRRHHLRRRHGR